MSEVGRRVLLIPMPGRRCCVDAMAMVRDWGWPKRVLNCACEMVQVLSRWSVCQLAVSWIAMESAGVCAFVAMGEEEDGNGDGDEGVAAVHGYGVFM